MLAIDYVDRLRIAWQENHFPEAGCAHIDKSVPKHPIEIVDGKLWTIELSLVISKLPTLSIADLGNFFNLPNC